MKAFAYLSILDATLKLSIIFLISVFGGDKLIFYAFLILCVSLLTRIVSMIYCTRNFEESKYKFLWDRTLFKQIGGFAGWNFLGNSAFTFSNEGVNMLLNIFGGTPVNAARGIAYQVKSVTTQFTSNILLAVNPRLIKLYSQKENEKFINLLFFISKATFFVMLFFCLPVILFAETILTLWLIHVPEYTVVFVKLILVFLTVRIFHSPINTLFLANGNIKNYQLIEAIILSSSVPISYMLLKINLPFYSVFISMIILELINFMAVIYLAKKMKILPVRDYFYKVMAPCFIVSVIVVPISFFIVKSFSNMDLYFQLLLIFPVLLLVVLSVIGFGLKNKERLTLLKYSESMKNKLFHK